MVREILKSSLKKEVFAKYENKCFICGYSLKPALRVHHIIPVYLGGKDEFDNFILLCSNCHTLVHFYSSKKYENKEIKYYLDLELRDTSIEKLKGLIVKVQNVKKEVEKNKNLWTKDIYSFNESMNMVSKKNKFTDHKKNLLLEILSLTMENIPKSIAQECSYRLLKSGKYISINLMNYLLFRTPAYTDLGDKPKFDCYIIFPLNVNNPSFLEDINNRIVFNFKAFDCVNLGLYYDEVLKFSNNDWNLFKKSCKMAQGARRTRNWVSNIDINGKRDENCV